MKIDAHQHFWNYSEKEYGWIPKNTPLERTWLPTDLAPLLQAAGLDGCIAVQARELVEESRWLLDLSNHNPIIRGVVGWVDLQSDKVEETLGELSVHPRFVGVRHVVQGEPDDRFMLRPAFLRGLGKLKQFKLKYDLLIVPKQLPAAIAVVQKLPDQPFVLDHIAKPFIKDGKISPWKEQILELSKSENVLCKVSGMVTEAKRGAWQKADFRPYLDIVFEAFGEDRLMFGSDWPVCLLSGTYPQVRELVDDYLEKLPAGTHAKVFGENCAKFYGVK